MTDSGQGPTPPGHSRRGHLWVPAAALAVLAFVATGITWAEGRASVDERPSAGVSASSVVSRAPRPTPATPVATSLPTAGPPRQVVIESLGIDAPVLPIVSRGRSLDPPSDPQDLGWWSEGARPGAATGTALITGHTVHDGGGALDDLETVRAGTEIRVRTTRGVIRYVADSVAVLDKDTIARQAPKLFDQQADGRLVLVTCEGWDGTGYRSNVVVTATPVA